MTRLALDVTDQESVDAALAAAGKLDALVSNAGETVRAPAESVPLTEVSRLFQLNTVGALRVAQAVLPGMRAPPAGGCCSSPSITGRVVVPLGGAYAASKWALEAIAEVIAIEAGHFGVKVTLLEPGAVSSGGSERAATLGVRGRSGFGKVAVGGGTSGMLERAADLTGREGPALRDGPAGSDRLAPR